MSVQGETAKSRLSTQTGVLIAVTWWWVESMPRTPEAYEHSWGKELQKRATNGARNQPSKPNP